jgi:thioredoxin-like negative regulator of GroEL
MRPAWKEVAEKFPTLEVVEYDFDDQKEMAEKYGVTKVPHTILLTADDQVIQSYQGMKDKADLIKMIEENIGK